MANTWKSAILSYIESYGKIRKSKEYRIFGEVY